MPYAESKGVQLYYEESGQGMPIVFVHEFSGDFRSWEAQMRHFSRRYRCVAFNARGYPPSEVPAAAAQYSHTLATDDIANLMRRLGIGRAHVIGCSMGAYSTLQFGLRYPRRALSLTVVGAGAGSNPARRAEFLKASAATARRFDEGGLAAAMKPYRTASNRIQLENKDPRAFREFFVRFAGHSALGHANTIRGVQMRRPPLQGMARRFAQLKVPLLVVVGDEDESSLATGLFLKRACPAARLAIAPATGHVVNVEEPELFNRITADFLNLVDSGRWRPRDPRSYNPSTMARKA
ncbi:MAG: alpha/beta hydrolase [Betaproteobacteria bacterium RIFCSPLOWO2_02_FULL_67_26]|nr:MAG: alpha/beta hydrolase [Betaproteobacteria bacterium RIFCSPLOWO2_02_FULL_67_26]